MGIGYVLNISPCFYKMWQNILRATWLKVIRHSDSSGLQRREVACVPWPLHCLHFYIKVISLTFLLDLPHNWVFKSILSSNYVSSYICLVAMNLFLLCAHVPASTIFLFMSGDLLQCFNLWFVKYILLESEKATPRRVQLVTVQARQRNWQQNNTLLGKHLCCAFQSSVGREARTVWEVEAAAPGLYLIQAQNKKN